MWFVFHFLFSPKSQKQFAESWAIKNWRIIAQELSLPQDSFQPSHVASKNHLKSHPKAKLLKDF